ncbi:MAG: hypothetical protein K0Q79_2399 [Flavipsychrobacter sp.]|jgi:hypothetical protein|nr:hypothetical protein [Flavipsychrobacter sp.]
MAEIIAFLNKRVHLMFALIVSVTLVLVNIIRILRVPITFDEPCYDPTESYWQLMMNGWGHANNHVLHSMLRKFFVEHIDYNTFCMRLDSLLALVFFLLFSWLLLGLLFNDRWWRLGAFVFLNILSPFLFEFWGLSRGYGLALMFMIVSIYYFIRYLKDKKILRLAISFVAAGLAVYSNFSYLNYYVSLAGTMFLVNIFFFREQPSKITRETVTFTIVTALFAMLIYEPLKNIYNNGEQSFLGSNGFVDDTVRSLVSEGLMMPNTDSITTLISWAVIVIACLCGAYWLFKYIKKKKSNGANLSTKYGLALFLLLFIPAASLIVQHALLNINYLTDRTALFFIALFALLFLYTLYAVGRSFPKLCGGLFLCILTLAAYNFLSKITLHSTRHWWFNTDDLVVLERIAAQSQNMDGKIKLSVSWTFEPTMLYNINQYYKGRFDTLKEFGATGKKDTTYDYYYLNSDQKIELLLPYYHRDTFFIGGSAVLWKKN